MQPKKKKRVQILITKVKHTKRLQINIVPFRNNDYSLLVEITRYQLLYSKHFVMSKRKYVCTI